MQKIFIILFIIVLLVGCCNNGDNNTISNTNTSECDWLYLCYVASDNNLGDPEAEISSMSRNVIDLMEVVGSNDKNKVVVFLDEKYSNTKEYYINEDIAFKAIKSEVVKDYGANVDSGDIEYLKLFIRSNVIKYKPKRIVLDVWNHGSGAIYKTNSAKYKGICYDNTSNNHITVQQLKRGLIEVERELNQKLNIIVLSACYMGGYEVAYQLRDCADYCLFSPPVIIGMFTPDLREIRGMDMRLVTCLPFQPYDKFLDILNNKTNEKDIAESFLTATYSSHVMMCSGFDASFTLFDLKRIEEINTKFLEFSSILNHYYSNDDTYRGKINTIINKTQSYEHEDGYLYSNLKDMGNFLSLIAEDDEGLPFELKNSAVSTRKAINNVIINRFYNPLDSYHDWNNCSGLSIVIPTSKRLTLSAEYLSYDFLINNIAWYEFLINTAKEVNKEQLK